MRKIRKRACWIILLIVLLILTFGPFWFGVGWNFMKGSKVSYRGKTIPVPFGWIATPRDWSASNDISFSKLPRNLWLSWLSPDKSLMTFEPIPQLSQTEPTRGYENWKKTTLQEHGPTTNKIIGPVQVGSPDKQAFCITILSADTENRGQISCLLFQATWRAIYVGDMKEKDRFLSVISGIK